MPEILHVTAARPVRDFVLWLRFSDGTEGEVDLGQELEGEVFEALRAPEVFAQVQLHPELRTLTWPNGADFAPEFLRALVLATA
jgi:hypothetical protein